MQRLTELVERERLHVELDVGALPRRVRARERAELRRRHGERAAPAQHVVESHLRAAEQRGLPRIASIQNGYSLLDRQFEAGLAEVAMRERVGLIAYSPLARGLLSGKSPGASGGEARARFSGRRLAAANAYVELAQRHGLEAEAMALAFVRQRPFVTSVLTAASSVAQLQRNLRSVELSLSEELLKEIDALHDAAPNPR